MLVLAEYHAAARQLLTIKYICNPGQLEKFVFNIISFGKRKENLVKSLETMTIGSNLSTFRDSVTQGATIFLHCDARIWGIAKVTGPYFFSETPIWSDKTYPHRYKIELLKLLSDPVELSDGVINAEFRKSFGSGWAYRFIFSPKPVPDGIAKLILEKVANGRSIPSKQAIDSISQNL